ncbi:MAG: DNA photolyase family protein [Bacteroidales bacterium]|jgi:deoxyribodipyrimidine photo-lyase|nr:DNA photolyase family protein [Bacteroidales bacterium]
MKICIFWFRRDLRLEDNTALEAALGSGMPVMPVFIFDSNILDDLEKDDPRVSFIYSTLSGINDRLRKKGSGLHIVRGNPSAVWKKLIRDFKPGAVYFNRDYEPYARERDSTVEKILVDAKVEVRSFRDQVIFEGNEILKSDGQPYTVFTPYSRKWLQKFREQGTLPHAGGKESHHNFLKYDPSFTLLEELGFRISSIRVRPYDLSVIPEYDKYRDLPAEDKTSFLSPHLRFGTVSIRQLVSKAIKENLTFLNELIWREFFMQILYHFPHVVAGNFRPVYDNIQWRNDEKEFRRWCNGETGYPIVDAGMRQLNETGWMHNRVRMIVSGFLCKDLLIDWQWGEAYFAEKLLDYELSSNNGNWQWAAGTGCDAAPWFRVFNPDAQQKKFDPGYKYVRRWVEDYGKKGYPTKIVDHNFARERAIEAYRLGIKKYHF